MKDGHEVKAVIFDLGNVLIDFDHRIAADKISKFAKKSAKEIFDLFFDSNITASFEEGKISPENFFRKVSSALNLNIAYEEFVPIWNEIFFLSKKNKEVYNLASQLKDRYKLALLSNINILHWEYVRDRFPIFDVFGNIVLSCEVGARKPDRLIYEKTLSLIGSFAGETFYTDDRSELVESAKSLGIKGAVFTDTKCLIKDLMAQGVRRGELNQ